MSAMQTHSKRMLQPGGYNWLDGSMLRRKLYKSGIGFTFSGPRTTCVTLDDPWINGRDIAQFPRSLACGVRVLKYVQAVLFWQRCMHACSAASCSGLSVQA